MNISRLLPFLPLLMLLPATSSAALVFPSAHQSHLNPSELCPLVQIVEHELCANHQAPPVRVHPNANNASDLCVLLHNYNTSFCAGNAPVVEPLSDDGMSIRILEKEFHEEPQDKDKDATIHKVCPIINFIEQELCTSRNEEIKVHFDPKELCPLLNLTYTEICE